MKLFPRAVTKNSQFGLIPRLPFGLSGFFRRIMIYSKLLVEVNRMERDYGGVCHLVCPANLVMCDERTLRLLAHDLEDAIFPGDATGAGVRYERLSIDE